MSHSSKESCSMCRVGDIFYIVEAPHHPPIHDLMHVLSKFIGSLDKCHIAIFKIILKVIKEYMFFGGCRDIILINKLVPGRAEIINSLMIIAAEKLTIAELVELINTQENILELY